VAIYAIVMAWLIVWKKNIVTKNIQVLSIVFMVFSWMALMIVGIFSVVIYSTNLGFPRCSQYEQCNQPISGFGMGVMHSETSYPV